MIGRSKRFNSKFLRDTEGLVTVQVVLFSVMLFGGIGLMMDFGRAYSAHSHMQSYVDQVALAAARQLDQSDGAISRATTAADAVAGSSTFTDGGDFSYDQIVFLSGAPTDANGNFDESMLSTLNTANSLAATHVLVQSSNESVALQLLNFANRDGQGIADIALRTQAVATSRRVACGGLSPLVMCNPFEGSSATSFRDEMDVGYRMQLTADTLDNARPQSDDSTIRLGLLKNPHETMHVRNTACTDLSLLPGKGTMDGVTDEELRDICLLATVDTGLSCINDQVVFKAADPYSVTTGLNVIFDIYDDSMADVMQLNYSETITSPFPATLGQLITRASLFHPDETANRERMDRDHFQQLKEETIFQTEYQAALDIALLEYAAESGEPIVTNPSCPFPAGTAPWLQFCTSPATADPSEIAAIEEERDERIAILQSQATAYDPNMVPNEFSRANYVHQTTPNNEWGPGYAAGDCLSDGTCALHTEIDNAAVGGNNIDSYAAALYRPYILRQIADREGTYWYDPSIAPDVSIEEIYTTNAYATYYQLHKSVESVNIDLRADTAIMGTVFEPSKTHRTNLDGDATTDLDLPPAADVAAYYASGQTDADLATLHAAMTAEQIAQWNDFTLLHANPGQFGLSAAPNNFLDKYGASEINTTDRRRKRVTVVNCSAAQTYAEATGEVADGYSDAYVGDVVDVVDMFLLEMPTVKSCSNSSADYGTDPYNNLPCTNAEITSVELHAEFVDSASSNPVDFDSRTFAVLVH